MNVGNVSREKVTKESQGAGSLRFECVMIAIYLAQYLFFCWFHQKYLRKQLIDLWSTYQNIQHL